MNEYENVLETLKFILEKTGLQHAHAEHMADLEKVYEAKKSAEHVEYNQHDNGSA